MEITKFSDLKSKFENALENAPHRDLLLHNETTELLEFINYIPNYRLFKKRTHPPFTKTGKGIFEIHVSDLNRQFISAGFQGYLETGGFRLIRFSGDTDEMYKIKLENVQQGVELFKYYKWLNELIATPQKTQKKNSLSHKEKMLALYYLGLDMRKFSNNKQSAIILSKILGLDESNTKDYLTYFDGNKGKVKTEANINKMLDLFENQDFKEIQKKIKDDLEK